MSASAAAAALVASAVIGAPDPLNIALWQISGYRSGFVTMTRPVVPGPLILAHDGVSADATAVGLTLIGSSYTDCLVRAEILVKNWDTATDIVCGGPAARLVGTNGAAGNWNGYFGYTRRFSGSSRRTGTRKYVTGAASNIGTETASLPTAWADGTTHVEMELELAGTSMTTRARLKGDGTWAREATDTDASLTAAGLVGVFCQSLRIGMSLEIHNFEVTA